jgi:hypothetical protein
LLEMAQVPEELCCGSDLRLEFSSKLWSPTQFNLFKLTIRHCD